MDTTLDEARRCPKCQEPGAFEKSEAYRSYDGTRRNVQRGAQLHTFLCMNPRCKWYQQVCRVVQVNPDGSIPNAETRREKAFPAIPDLTAQVQQQLRDQVAAELAGGAEVYR